MKVAILGGGSCFAVNLAHHLTARGDQVLSISRSPIRGPAFTLGLELLGTGWPEEDGWGDRFIYKQAHLVTELPQTMAYLDRFRPEVIYNFAALCEVGLSWLHPVDYYQTNVIALVRLCEELQKRSWFKRFIQIGSSEVYGSVSVAADESHPMDPSSPYATSKAAFDMHLRAICHHQAFNASILMPSNGYCEGQTLNRIIPKTIIAALTGQKIKLQGGGVARKSYLHGDDISRAAMLVASDGQIGETYNVGPQDHSSIRELVGTIGLALDKFYFDLAEDAPERRGQDSQYWLDSSKIKAIGWKQEVSLAEGLSRMISWVRKYPELLAMEQGYAHRP